MIPPRSDSQQQSALEALLRLEAARRVIDDMIAGRTPTGLLEVARAAHLVEEARDLLWVASWNRKGVA